MTFAEAVACLLAGKGVRNTEWNGTDYIKFNDNPDIGFWLCWFSGDTCMERVTFHIDDFQIGEWGVVE